jgi:hypothetical protein
VFQDEDPIHYLQTPPSISALYPPQDTNDRVDELTPSAQGQVCNEYEIFLMQR